VLIRVLDVAGSRLFRIPRLLCKKYQINPNSFFTLKLVELDGRTKFVLIEVPEQANVKKLRITRIAGSFFFRIPKQICDLCHVQEGDPFFVEVKKHKNSICIIFIEVPYSLYYLHRSAISRKFRR